MLVTRELRVPPFIGLLRIVRLYPPGYLLGFAPDTVHMGGQLEKSFKQHLAESENAFIS